MTGARYRIGVDYDGTLADTNRMKARWIREHLGRDVPPWQCDRSSCVPIIGEDSYETMANAVYERKWSLQAPAVAGALDAVKALSARAKLYVVSARLPRRMEFVRLWLQRHGIAGLVSGLLTSAGSDKETLCRRHGLHVLIDDDERHLRGLRRDRVLPILLKPGMQGALDVPPDVELCRSWREVLLIIGPRTQDSGS